MLPSCSSMLCFNCANWGAHELGNNLVLLGGDRIEDRVIVYCTGRSSSDCCNGGSFVLPVYKDHMIKGKYNYFVKRRIHEKKSKTRWAHELRRNIFQHRKSKEIIMRYDLRERVGCTHKRSCTCKLCIVHIASKK